MPDPIDRRAFLLRTSALGGALALPPWMARAFRPQDLAGDDRVAELRKARDRAVARGKPVLVFVVPGADDQLWERGRQLGAFVNHGGRDALLDLALCEPACATSGEIREVFSKVRIGHGPWMVVIEPESQGFRAARPELGKLAEPPNLGEAEDYETWKRLALEHAQAIVARVHRALRRALAPDVAALVERADAVRSTLGDDQRAAVERILEGGRDPDRRLVFDAAAVLRVAAAAPRTEGDRERILALVAAAARDVYVVRRIPGSKWASSSGCGMNIEGEEAAGLAIACGMAMVPPLSERFLYFFTAE